MTSPLFNPKSIFYQVPGDRFRELIPPALIKDEISVYARADGSIEVLVGTPAATGDDRFLEVWGGTILFEETRADGMRVLGFYVCQHDLSKPRIVYPDESFYPGQAFPGLGHPVSLAMVKRIEDLACELAKRHSDLVAIVYPFIYFHEYQVFRHDLGFHLGAEEHYPQNRGIAAKLLETEGELEKAGLRRAANWRWNLKAQTWHVLNEVYRADLQAPPVMEKELTGVRRS